LAGGAIAAVAPPEVSRVVRDSTHDHLACITLHAPQSRGPPHFPV